MATAVSRLLEHVHMLQSESEYAEHVEFSDIFGFHSQVATEDM